MQAGPSGPGLGADDASFGSTVWSNPTNIQALGGPVSVCALGTAISFEVVKLVVGGVVVNPNKSSGAAWSTSALTFVPFTFTIPADLALSVSQVNDTNNFGAVLACTDGLGHSHFLNATQFGFSIPSDATITSVLVEWKVEDGGGGSAWVDYVQITITYQGPGGGALKASRSAGVVGVAGGATAGSYG
jgi:hypothetical protein